MSMMLNSYISSFSCLSSSIQNSQKISFPAKFHSLPYEKTIGRSNVGKLSVLYNGYPYFTAPCHPLQSELLKPIHQQQWGHCDMSCGIGILEFFKGKNILVTGGTGLVGKAFIEKLLRTTEVNKIYVLIKAEDKEAALDRLTKEIADSELFKCLQEKYRNYYQSFVREKLIAVAGNICEANLGMDSDTCRAIAEDVDVIVESAASTALNDRYDVLIDANTNAPQRLMRFAKTCKNLKLFVHFSTAYVNGKKEGLVFEKPMTMGENGRNEDDNNDTIPRLDLADEISLAMKSCNACARDDATKYLKKLGLQRANFFGWYNTYHMTKAMGEMVLNEIREDMPVLIMRPSVIESSYKDPFPGWIQGNRMFDPVIISHGKGQLPAFLADPQAHMDIVPVDLVVNSTIAAIAKHGVINKPQLNVYHVATGVVNPLRFSNFFNTIHDYFTENPLVDDGNISKMKCFDDFDDFSKFTRTEISKCNGRVGTRQSKAKIAYAEQLCKMYEFIGFYKGRFHTGNIQKLLQEMSKEEQVGFDVDARNIDWKKYFYDIHIPGLRRHIINGHKISV